MNAQQRYVQKHKEELKEYQASYYQLHKEELRIKRQAYRDANRDKVAKWGRANYLRKKERMENGEQSNRNDDIE